MNNDAAIGVGAVGVLPEEDDGILSDLPEGTRFQLRAFSDEGLEVRGPQYRPVPYYSDYNMLLQDPYVELVLVNGPVDLRRDLAVRALNAGRHVVLPLPFAETAVDAERIMKTAARQGLVATADSPWRDDPDLLALQDALAAEELPHPRGIILCTALQQATPPIDPLAYLLQPELTTEQPEEALSELVEREGVAVMDQLQLVANDYVKSVNTHLLRSPAGAEEGFMTYLALRNGGWAIAQAAVHGAPALPRWAVTAPGGSITVSDGAAAATSDLGAATYVAPPQTTGFWNNVYDAIRSAAPLKCPAADIVRAMKLQEAALESLETGEPATV